MSNVYDAKNVETKYYPGLPGTINRSQHFLPRITDVSHTSPNTGSISYYGKQNTSWSLYFSDTGSLPGNQE